MSLPLLPRYQIGALCSRVLQERIGTAVRFMKNQANLSRPHPSELLRDKHLKISLFEKVLCHIQRELIAVLNFSRSGFDELFRDVSNGPQQGFIFFYEFKHKNTSLFADKPAFTHLPAQRPVTYSIGCLLLQLWKEPLLQSWGDNIKRDQILA